MNPLVVTQWRNWENFTVEAGIVAYILFGALLWNRWIKRLPEDNPMRRAEVEQTSGFGPAMDWALFTVKLVFFLVWPAFASLRIIFNVVDIVDAKVKETVISLPQLEDRSSD